MPIYAYKCDSCGFAKDVLQKISDAPLSQCPSCNAEAFRKQVTAAGFQLKGSGWYVTDFRGGNNGAAAKSDDKPAETSGAKADSGGDAPSTGKSESKTESKAESRAESKAESKPAATPAPKKPEASSGSGSSS